MTTSQYKKAIILAGGSGSRLAPVTLATSKQLLPIYNKPTIYYSISMSMLLGITDIALIVTPQQRGSYKKLLGDGSDWGIKISYIDQVKPRGIAEAIQLSASFIGQDNFMLLLGDNLFFGHDLIKKILDAQLSTGELILTTYNVSDPAAYGVAEYGLSGNIRKIWEKPLKSPSNRAVTGLYFYPNIAVKIAEELQPSSRGELEITDLNNLLLENTTVKEVKLGRADAWFDTGTFDQLHSAAMFVKSIENQTGQLIGSIDEISYSMGLVSKSTFVKNVKRVEKSEYGSVLKRLLDPKIK